MAAPCQTLLRLRDASGAALIHHVGKSIGRYEVGSAFRGSSTLNVVGDGYVLLTPSSVELSTIELRFQLNGEGLDLVS